MKSATCTHHHGPRTTTALVPAGPSYQQSRRHSHTTTTSLVHHCHHSHPPPPSATHHHHTLPPTASLRAVLAPNVSCVCGCDRACVCVTARVWVRVTARVTARVGVGSLGLGHPDRATAGTNVKTVHGAATIEELAVSGWPPPGVAAEAEAVEAGSGVAMAIATQGAADGEHGADGEAAAPEWSCKHAFDRVIPDTAATAADSIM